MKYIKTFESWENSALYKKGDYIELSDSAIKENGLNDIFENIGLIVKNAGLGQKHRIEDQMYDVDYLRNDFQFENLSSFYVMEKDIIRKLSPEEIEELEAKLAARKYNL